MYPESSWYSQQKRVKLASKVGMSLLLSTWGVRHVRWGLYLIGYIKWWCGKGYAGGGLFHHPEDIKILKSIWRGLL